MTRAAAAQAVACSVLATAALLGAGALAAPVEVGALRADIALRSMREMRDAGVVRQGRDYSCGAAALATLLTFGLGDAVDEEVLLDALLRPMTAEQLQALQKNGLSLADMQRLAEARGHRAQGFRVAAEQITRIARPVVVFIRPGGYEHFAVLKGVQDGRAHLADPSLGNVRMPLARFVEQWADAGGRGVVMAIERGDGQWPERYALQIGSLPPPLAARAHELVPRAVETLPSRFAPP